MNKELKELRRLQRDLNSNRLLKYNLGDTSEEEQARTQERAKKLTRFNELLIILNKEDNRRNPTPEQQNINN